jgi:hypothetical protein
MIDVQYQLLNHKLQLRLQVISCALSNNLIAFALNIGAGASGKELTQAICRAAHKLIRSVPDTNRPSLLRQMQTVQASAYSCLVVVVSLLILNQVYLTWFTKRCRRHNQKNQFMRIFFSKKNQEKHCGLE